MCDGSSQVYMHTHYLFFDDEIVALNALEVWQYSVFIVHCKVLTLLCLIRT